MGIQNVSVLRGVFGCSRDHGRGTRGMDGNPTLENGANCPKADSSDWVFLGYFYDTLRRSPQLTLDYMPRRIDEKITIEIPPADQPEGTRLHLYLFFGNEEFTQFSPSEYVEL